MPQELIRQIMEQADISEESATKAVHVVIDFVKERAPAPVAAQIEQYLTDERVAAGVSAAKSALGGMFGKKKGE
jgi:nucleoid DNA-binding protein